MAPARTHHRPSQHGRDGGEDEKALPNSNCIISRTEKKSIVCVFCKSHKLDELNWGRMLGTDGVYTHYFCMLFSSALSQNGTDNEGILGFLAVDILKEVKRASKLKCAFCGELGASIGCCNKRCKTLFHFPCGLGNGANNRFHSQFESFCKEHANHEPVTLSGSNETCPICMAPVNLSQRLVKGSCCKASLFHKECIQKMALSAGYLFKCPTCNKTRQFIHEMRSMGIFVPDQDASWELDNGFQDLYVQYSHCDAETCSCSQGRDHFDDKGPWILARCRLCGAAGVHKRCGKLSDENVEKWACQPCTDIEKKAKTAKSNPKPVSDQSTSGPSRNNVSATVNRKPKNKSTPKPTASSSKLANFSDDSDENFTLASCYVSSRCFSYFPYSRSRLRKMTRTTLPDWRDLELRVNLVKWIPNLIAWDLKNNQSSSIDAIPNQFTSFMNEAEASSSHYFDQRSQSPSPGCSSSFRHQRCSSPTIIELEAEEVMSDIMQMEYEEILPSSSSSMSLYAQSALLKYGRRTKRKSTWSTGVYASRAKKFPKVQKSDSRTRRPSATITSSMTTNPTDAECRTSYIMTDPECESMELEETQTNKYPLEDLEIFKVKMDSFLGSPTAPSLSPPLADIFNMVVESEVEVGRQAPSSVSDDNNNVDADADLIQIESTIQGQELKGTRLSESPYKNAGDLHPPLLERYDARDDTSDSELASIPDLDQVVTLEPTPEQMNSFKAMGNRLRTELSQNNRENEFSPSNASKVTFLNVCKNVCTDYAPTPNRRKQWLCPDSIKERQALLAEPELSNVQPQ